MTERRSFLLWVLTGSLLLIPAAGTDAAAAPDELARVARSIERSGARWFAQENPISRLAPQERRLYLGALPLPEDRTAAAPARALDKELPARLDWRDRDGASWVTPVRDQGPCGSCWGFSAVGAVESAILLRSGNPALAPTLDLAEQALLSCTLGGCGGWFVGPALNYIQSTGLPDEACFPYQADDAVPCGDRCADWADRARKISGSTLIPSDVDSIRNALQLGPVTVTFSLYTDFYYYGGGIYEHVWGDYEGGHAVLIVGYDDVEHAWIVKNSWGASWGEDGYFRILWGDSGMGGEVYLVDYENPCDDDEDGFTDLSCGGDDCDDSDPAAHPGAAEACDGKDTDCDGATPAGEADGDADGWPLCGDCDDADGARNPGVSEVCGDGVDNDCSGAAEDRDLDGDGALDPACGGADCDDGDADRFPGAAEVCDARDNDCDALLPAGEQDGDGDGWIPCAGDCDDADGGVHPGRKELCSNGVDDDCDGYVDGDDTECSGSGWAAAAPAEASSGATAAASGAGNTGLWLALPLAALALLARFHRRNRG